jgi:hypothetical protein
MEVASAAHVVERAEGEAAGAHHAGALRHAAVVVCTDEEHTNARVPEETLID